MGNTQQDEEPSRRELFEDVLSGKQQRRPFIPRLRSDPSPFHPLAQSLEEFRKEEGDLRETRLRALWKKIPHPRAKHADANGHGHGNGGHPQDVRFDVANSRWEPANAKVEDITPERAEHLTRMYHDELLKECALEDGMDPMAPVTWSDFKQYANYKEAGARSLFQHMEQRSSSRFTELWHIFHDELDLDGNGHLETDELAMALGKAGMCPSVCKGPGCKANNVPPLGVNISASKLNEFMSFITSSQHSHAVSFSEFRDFLLLLPRRANPAEMYRFYEVRKYMGDDGRGGAARVTMEGAAFSFPRDEIHPNTL